MEHNGTPEKDAILALALASGVSIADAAAQADVGRTTVYRKLENPEFRRLVAEYRDRLIATALGRIADNLTRSADVLAQMLDSPKEYIRIRAARALFSVGMKLRDSVDLTTRMREVELELARKQGVVP
jgi:AcrR family transcriptional regulator